MGRLTATLSPAFRWRATTSGAVLLVLHISVFGSCHHQAVNLQTGAGGQRVARSPGVTVDGEGQAVDTRARNSKDTSLCTVAITQIDGYSDIVENVLCFCQFLLQLSETCVEEHLHPLYLLLHHIATTRPLVSKAC